ncbi:MAG: ribbon-helix-helix protein, CopG family [Zestosphaera sp.]
MVSLRIDEELVKKLNKRASELGVGITTLMRRYVEFMLLHESTRSYPMIWVSSAEYTYLAKIVSSDAELVSRYVDYVSELYKSLIQVFGGEFTDVSEVLRKLLELLKLEGKVLEFRLTVEKDVVNSVVTAISEESALLLGKVLERILAPRRVEMRCFENMMLLRVRRF